MEAWDELRALPRIGRARARARCSGRVLGGTKPRTVRGSRRAGPADLEQVQRNRGAQRYSALGDPGTTGGAHSRSSSTTMRGARRDAARLARERRARDQMGPRRTRDGEQVGRKGSSVRPTGRQRVCSSSVITTGRRQLRATQLPHNTIPAESAHQGWGEPAQDANKTRSNRSHVSHQARAHQFGALHRSRLRPGGERQEL